MLDANLNSQKALPPPKRQSQQINPIQSTTKLESTNMKVAKGPVQSSSNQHNVHITI
jgi:hypothetical protein